jgi:hypothetical protein
LKQQTRINLTSVFLLILILPAPAAAQKHATEEEKDKAADLPAVIWRDRHDIATLNLFYGAGGKEHAPDPNGKYTFVKEELEGHSPKFDVEDEQGIRWRVKLGQEPKPETAATRLLWAAGYFVDEDYYLAEFKVKGLPELHRGGNFISADGTVHRARLERRRTNIKKLGDWDWFDNDFAGTKELNGLRVMMALLNNWDLSGDNNSIYKVGNERRYLVSDAGATFGKTGNSFRRSKSVLRDYAASKFIEKVTADYVNLVMHSRPFFLTIFNVPNYRARTRMERVTKHIPLADAKWLGQRLSQLSEEQVRDCFRAAGYNPEEVEGYTKAVEKRIAELNSL